MAIKLTLPASSPALAGGGYQGLEFYVRIAGIHYVKRANRCALPLEYFANEADAKAEPEGPQVFPIGLPVTVQVPDPAGVLDSESNSTRLVCYLAVKDVLVALGGQGTVVAPC